MTTQSTNNPEAVAAQFVDDQLAAAQASLRRTRAFCVASVLFVAAYMSFITHTLHTRLLSPKPAAKLATTYTCVLVQQQGDALTKQLVRDVPSYIAGLPDVFLAELPKVRQDLENNIDQQLRACAQQISTQWGQQMDAYLVSHRDDVLKFVEGSQNPQTVAQLGDRFETETLRYLNTKAADGTSAMDKLQQGLAALNEVEAKLNRLAHAKDLTAQEKTLRQLIAVTLKSANNNGV